MKIDQTLIEDCIKQKRLAQNELYKLVFSFLMNICIRYKNDYGTAGASLNAIFLKILTNLENFQTEQSFFPWIKRIAVNHCIDEYRKEQRVKKNVSYQDDVSVGKLPNLIHEKEAELDSEYLLEMIKTLPNVTGKVFNLYAIDGFKHREIAEILEMSENTSKWHLSQARKQLQEKLKVFNENVCL